MVSICRYISAVNDLQLMIPFATLNEKVYFLR